MAVFIRRPHRMPYGPDGYQMAMAAWAASVAFSWGFTADLWEKSVVVGADGATIGSSFDSLRLLPISEQLWAAFLAAYAAVAVFCLFYGTPAKRAALGIVGTLMWAVLGVNLLVGGLRVGIYSPMGMFDCLCAVGSVVCVWQWAEDMR